jgi:hypothetical protein
VAAQDQQLEAVNRAVVVAVVAQAGIQQVTQCYLKATLAAQEIQRITVLVVAGVVVVRLVVMQQIQHFPQAPQVTAGTALHPLLLGRA